MPPRSCWPDRKKLYFQMKLKPYKIIWTRAGGCCCFWSPRRTPGLKEFLAAYGIVPDDRMILDDNQVSRALGASVTMPLVIQYGKHRITQDFSNVVTIFPLARPLFLAKDLPKSVQLTPLAITTQTSWAKQGQDWIKAGKAEFNAATRPERTFYSGSAGRKTSGGAGASTCPRSCGKPSATPPVPKQGEAQKPDRKKLILKKAPAAETPDDAKKAAGTPPMMQPNPRPGTKLLIWPCSAIPILPIIPTSISPVTVIFF